MPRGRYSLLSAGFGASTLATVNVMQRYRDNIQGQDRFSQHTRLQTRQRALVFKGLGVFQKPLFG